MIDSEVIFLGSFAYASCITLSSRSKNAGVTGRAGLAASQVCHGCSQHLLCCLPQSSTNSAPSHSATSCCKGRSIVRLASMKSKSQMD